MPSGTILPKMVERQSGGSTVGDRAETELESKRESRARKRTREGEGERARERDRERAEGEEERKKVNGRAVLRHYNSFS
jgi:hypothetical protein